MSLTTEMVALQEQKEYISIKNIMKTFYLNFKTDIPLLIAVD